MAYVPKPDFPDFTGLMKSLNQSKISIANPALYQTIKGLMDRVAQFKDLSKEEFTSIVQNINDLTDIINNVSIGEKVSLGAPFMPTFDGEDGEDGIGIPGRDGIAGRDGLDGKTIPPFDDCCGDGGIDALIPFGSFSAVAEAASELSITTTGNIDDLDFGNARFIRMNNASLATIRGLKAGKAGQLVTIISVGAGIVELAHQNGGSVAANRLQNTATSANTSLAAGFGIATYQYDGTSAYWKLVNHVQGNYITIAFSAGDYTAGGAMTLTVGAAPKTMKYYLIGSKMNVQWWINGATVGGVAGVQLILDNNLFGGFTVKGSHVSMGLANVFGVGFDYTFNDAGDAGEFISIYRGLFGNWGLGATNLHGQIDFEVD